MLSLLIYAGKGGSDIAFRNDRYGHNPHESSKKAFYCLNIIYAIKQDVNR